MRTRHRVVALVLLFTFLAANAPLGAQADHDSDMAPQNAEVAPLTGRWVVGFDTLPADLEAGTTWEGAEVYRVHDRLRHAVLLSDDAGFASRVSARDDVAWAEPDVLLHALLSPNDARWDEQYGPSQIGAPLAWDTTLGDTDRNVCVLDTGVRLDHEDISGPRWMGGWDFVSNDALPSDGHGHGTHVTGIAAATTDNARGIAGVAQAGILHVRVLNSSGSGFSSDVAEGIDWCAANEGHVINMSLGSSSNPTVIANAAQAAWNSGMLLIAAAGNDGPCSNCVLYPAALSTVVAVACTTSSLGQCSFSAEGSQVELAAPGSGILSTCYGSLSSYCSKSGTSMSAPHVAGAAALVWSYAPELSNTDVRSLLQNTAMDQGSAGRDTMYGYGIVDVAAALAGAPSPTPPATVLFEDFEDGLAQNWTLGGQWHVDDKCPIGNGDNQYLGFHQRLACVYAGLPDSFGTATFPVDLRGASEAALKFSHRWQTESSSSVARDQMHVQASDGSGSWRTLAWWDSRDPNQPKWSNVTLDLERYLGTQAQIRFRFDAVNLFENHYNGWHIDNVEILSNGIGS